MLKDKIHDAFCFSVLCDNCIVKQFTSIINFREKLNEKKCAEST